MEVMFTKECSNFGKIRLQTGPKMIHYISRISRNFSREMGHFFSHLARNPKREKCACLVRRDLVYFKIMDGKHYNLLNIFQTLLAQIVVCCSECLMTWQFCQPLGTYLALSAKFHIGP